MIRSRWLHALGLSVALVPAWSLAWTGFDVSEGPLRLCISEIAEVTDLRESVPVGVLVENRSQGELVGVVQLRDVVDRWEVVGADRRPFRLVPGGQASFEFRLRTGLPVYSALYPVHACATVGSGRDRTEVRAVRVFSVRLLAVDASLEQPPTLTPNRVAADGALPLWVQRTHRIAWQYLGQPPVYKSPGWLGTDSASRTSAAVQTVSRGDARVALALHPPYVPGAGTVFWDYTVTLPPQAPILLRFATAIRDSRPPEPNSDGVRFRVWAGLEPDGSDASALFDRFSDAKVWTPGEADLTPFAGQTVLLRFESDPGPNHDTTCDASYWAEPLICAGPGAVAPPRLSLGPGEAEHNERVARECLAGRPAADEAMVLALDPSPATGPSVAVIRLGAMGLLDAVVTLATPTAAVSCRGFLVDLEDLPAGRWPGACQFRSYTADRHRHGLTVRHRVLVQGTETELRLDVRQEGPLLRVSARCPRRITQFSVGPWDRPASRVYYGHGYAIVNPESFRVGFGGHNLASSHVGFEFDGGLALLQAVDNPPDALTVNPESRTYALTTHQNATLSLVAGDTAFACAVAYRPWFDKEPAAGVQRLAGRFCFDIWGGRYGDIADSMQRMLDYGLSDSILTVHDWQRWGYDYRLPDVYPPNPARGSVEDLRRLAAICASRDVPWGLHDNYIDFYPDATDFSYREVCFSRDGRPVPAWYNEGRDAQSYRWRPDRILPFVKRNLRQVKSGLGPTHYFLDVFTSAGCGDWWDADGKLHTSLETRQHWGQTFAWIRRHLGGDAPTTSEAGHDQLIGYLDGADCQWLRLVPDAQRYTNRLACADWEYVPWYDAVNHARFILHGVGYSNRYQGGRSRASHGINSDDYLGNELLSGHALMVDASSWGRAAVRKYYLAQDAARNLALQNVSRVSFVDGDLHRLQVGWENGTVVSVNRGPSDWQVNGRCLPRYGFVVEYGSSWATVERRAGLWAESSCGASGWYCNARNVLPESSHTLSITPAISEFRYLGGRAFSWTMVWHADAPADKDMLVFVHFCARSGKRRDAIVFQDDHAPPVPTRQWRGSVPVERQVSVPEAAEGEYAVMVGLHDGQRRALLRGGLADGESRVQVGTIVVERDPTGVSEIRYTPPPPAQPEPPLPVNPSGTRVDFGFAVTDGAFRVEPQATGLRLVPLPDSPPFGIVLRPGVVLGREVSVKAVNACAAPGQAELVPVTFRCSAGEIAFEHDGKSFAYRLDW